MRLLELSFLAATLFSTAWANDPKCPLQVPSPFCRYDKSRPEYAKCSLPDRLLYQNDTRKDTVSYQCPAEAGGEPIELVASKSHYRNDYLWNALYEDWDEPIVTYIRKYFEDWPTFSEQMGFRENPVYSVKMPYMKFFDKNKYANLDLTTLQGLHFSASKQFGTCEFGILCRHFYYELAEPTFQSPTASVKVIVVDLRDESHLLLNGLPVYFRCKHNWGNRYLYAVDSNLSDADRLLEHRRRSVEKDRDEVTRRHHLEACDSQVMFKANKSDTTIEYKPLLELMTEAEHVDNMNGQLPWNILSDSKLKAFEYVRIRTADHACPTVETINEFVDVVLLLHSVGKKSGYLPWFHFHCNGGKGRSTFFMTAYDMLANAHNTPFEVIINRQRIMNNYPKLGTLYQPSEIGTIEGEDPLEQAEKNMRTEVLEQFYNYCKELGPILRSGGKSPRVFSIPKELKSKFKEEAKAAKEVASASQSALSAILAASVIAVLV